MDKLSTFLLDKRKIGQQEREIRELIKEGIKKVADVDVALEQISYKSGVVRCAVTGPLRTEIMFKKRGIIEFVNKSGSKYKIERIV